MRIFTIGLLITMGIVGCTGTDGVPSVFESSAGGISDGERVFQAGDLGAVRAAEAAPRQMFDDLLDRYEDMTYEELIAALPERTYREGLSFDPADVSYYNEAVKKLKLTDEETTILRRNGFVSVDHDQRYSFRSAYYAIYTRDLPVLITADSILHALHKTYDELLMELEITALSPNLRMILDTAHETLATMGTANRHGALAENYSDVDLYLTVARNLIRGAATARDPDNTLRRIERQWDGNLIVSTAFGQDKEALAILEYIRSLELQFPMGPNPEGTAIYGGRRYVDYTQFKPRGHYLKAAGLPSYFRTLMWLGRADSGFNMLPPDPQSGLKVDADRELRDAALLTMVLAESGTVEHLRGMSDIIEVFVGGTDNLTVFEMLRLLGDIGIGSFAQLAAADTFQRLREAVLSGDYGAQLIRSQVLMSDPATVDKVQPPALFQMFGQRYIPDSFVLSQVVYDSILFKDRKQERRRPKGLDVAAAMGNDEAVILLEDELRRWHYSANLLACREFLDLHTNAFWEGSLYTVWLDALRLLDGDMTPLENAPEVMQTRVWQRKQLQTFLGSWAELRHDTILYAKQSYTAGIMCEYPTGYIEPYPELYAGIQRLVLRAARLLEKITVPAESEKRAASLARIRKWQVAFLENMALILGRLVSLARKELAAERFSAADTAFIKKTVDIRGGGSGPAHYDGWYPQLIYKGTRTYKSYEPVIIDVHTDPNTIGGDGGPPTVLQVGVGDVNFLVAAIDNDDDRMIYAGPVFSYYEFAQPVTERLTDAAWELMLRAGRPPSRPAWVGGFQGPRKKRTLRPVKRRQPLSRRR